MPTLLKSKTVTARKPHHCGSCFTVAVNPGETYQRDTYLFDGRVYDWVNCAECDKAAKSVHAWNYYDDEGIGETTYAEWARDVGWNAGAEDEPSEEQQAALAYLVRRFGTIIDHPWIGVSGHPDDPECAHRSDGTDATYCSEPEHKHLWSTR